MSNKGSNKPISLEEDHNNEVITPREALAKQISLSNQLSISPCSDNTARSALQYRGQQSSKWTVLLSLTFIFASGYYCMLSISALQLSLVNHFNLNSLQVILNVVFLLFYSLKTTFCTYMYIYNMYFKVFITVY